MSKKNRTAAKILKKIYESDYDEYQQWKFVRVTIKTNLWRKIEKACK